MEKYLNHKTCSECQGQCCKRSGCVYLPEDFSSMEYDYLLNILNIGNISICINIFNTFIISLPNSPLHNKIFWSYYLYLRSRNIGGDIVDFFGGENTCSMLSEEGCIYSDSERPSLGLSLIPCKTKGEECVQLANKYLYEIMYDWIKYQKVLEQLVIKFAGKTSIQLLAEKSELDPTSFWASYYKRIQEYIYPDDALKIKCEMNKITIDESVDVKKLILNQH